VAHAWGWQGIFIILLFLGIILLGMAFPLQESLSRKKRFSGRLTASLTGYKEVLRIKGFASYSIVYALAMATLFAYISATPFIVQDLFGFSELQFSLVFAVNAIALASGSALSLRFKTMSKAALYGSAIAATLAAIGVMSEILDPQRFHRL